MALAFLCLILIYLGVERIRHERRLKRIPVRIHVNGTRGKSSVTRLIAAALRESGIRTLAKTTGTLPKLILPDGSEETIRRRSPANILEQMKIVKRADRLNAQAIVVECMALDPALQFVSEAAMIDSTLGVITNVRPDHFEVMGRCLDDIADALSQSIPAGGILVTGDRRYFPLFSDVASRRGSRAVLAGNPDPNGRDATPRGIHLFLENNEIARSVCLILGLDPAVVDSCLNDVVVAGESAGIFRISVGGKAVLFIDAFSANDVESTRIIQERALAQHACPRPWVALFNNRADRPLRMKSFADDLLTGSPYDLIAVTGEGRRLAHRYLRGKVPEKEIVVLSNTSPHQLLDELLRNTAWKECTIVGMGNEKGRGGSFSRLFKEQGVR
jgi:poly-gamma-glutamate synthase PgsB/CapB